jgi:murein DD-endopeptidase MepM/ murein hydrolase activator NlpD
VLLSNFISKPAIADLGEGCSLHHWNFPVNSDSNPKIKNHFDDDIGDYQAGHRGVDLLAESGDDVFAPASGVVSWVGIVGGRPTITILVKNLKTTYSPVLSFISKGESVQKGQKIGKVSKNSLTAIGYCLDKCLHWGVSLKLEENNKPKYINPEKQVYRKRIVLKKIE